jgi:hypothetical protein
MVGYLHPCPHRMLQEHNMISPARTNACIFKFIIQVRLLEEISAIMTKKYHII